MKSIQVKASNAVFSLRKTERKDPFFSTKDVFEITLNGCTVPCLFCKKANRQDLEKLETVKTGDVFIMCFDQMSTAYTRKGFAQVYLNVSSVSRSLIIYINEQHLRELCMVVLFGSDDV